MEKAKNRLNHHKASNFPKSTKNSSHTSLIGDHWIEVRSGV